jgi:hypothetical protein
MNNIINTFNINKTLITENDKVESNENNIDEDNISDLIIKKKKLIEMTNNLTKIEYIEILNIIQEDKCSYSNNTNGVFINLTNVEYSTIDKIFNFLKFTKQKKMELKKKEEYLESFKKDIKNEDIKTNIDIESEFNSDEKSVESLSDNSANMNYNDYLCFSSDDEDNIVIKK